MESDPAEVIVIKESFVSAKIINNVRVVENAERALDYLYRRGTFSQVLRPDLLLMNSSLPQMTGLELLQTVRSAEEFTTLPVAILSSSGDQSEVQRAEALKANWYITKPIDSGQLLDVVRTSTDLWLCVVTVPEAVILRKRRARAPH